MRDAILFVFIVVALFLSGCSEQTSGRSEGTLLPPTEEIIQPVSPPIQDDSEPVPQDDTTSQEENLNEGNLIVDPISKNSVLDEPLFIEQWSLYEDSRFYRRNRIALGASIQSADNLNTYRGRGVNIAIIDDGVDTSHEDLVGAISNRFDLATRTSDVTHSNDADMHGTAVTGIIGARLNSKGLAGVASESNILFLKFKRFMSDSETLELFEKAEEFRADIISNSWGTGNVSPIVKAKIVDLATNGRNGKGVSIVFAAGNESVNIDGDEASIPEVISVGATNKYNLRADYSNYGAALDIVAPGGEYLGITTLDPSGVAGVASIDEDYLLYNDSNGFVGTSASAPIVSGVIALMLEKNPNLTRVQIENILKNTADKIGSVSYDGNGHNDYYGHGKVNLSRAMNEL